jgi:hypothetical protein
MWFHWINIAGNYIVVACTNCQLQLEISIPHTTGPNFVAGMEFLKKRRDE